MTINPAKNSHRTISIIARTLRFGERESIPALSTGVGVSVEETGSGVEVSVGVLVAGNTSVIAGNGARVVVGVATGVSVVVGVLVLWVGVLVANNEDAAWATCPAVTIVTTHPKASKIAKLFCIYPASEYICRILA